MTHYLPSMARGRVMIVRVCMDCGEIMGIKKGGSGESHGICDSCLRARLEEIGGKNEHESGKHGPEQVSGLAA